MNPKSKQFAAKLWQATMRGCTIAVLVLLIFFLIMSLSVSYTPGMNFTSLITLVAFSLVISYSRGFLELSGVPLVLRHLLRFFAVGVAYFFVLLGTTQAYLVGFILYAVAYALFLAASLLFHRFSQKGDDGKRPQAPYESRFS